MPYKSLAAAVACATLELFGAAGAAAQGLETLGNRAAAMSAFVAVADDASAVAWNPSGLASGALFNLSVDFGRVADEPDRFPLAGGQASRAATRLVALSTWPLGLSYYRIATTEAVDAAPAVLGTASREDGQVAVRTLVTSHLGVTVLQSIGAHLTLGATAKVVRGSVGAALRQASSWDGALEAGEDVDREGDTRGDIDIGAMVAAGSVRAGLVVRNATTPTFGEASLGTEVTLRRHARVGVAWGSGWPGTAGTVAAVDADLTRVPHVSGDRRDVAAGVERWMGGRRLGLRGGVRASTIGDARPVVSVGASYAPVAAMYIDVFLARGEGEMQAWGFGARLTY